MNRIETLQRFLALSLRFHLISGLLIRMIFLIFGEIHDQFSSLKYTDVDYFVFSDAATYVSQGKSPFLRHTYRYSPVLAFMLTPNIYFRTFGKFLFVIFDILTGYLIFLCSNARSTKQRKYSVIFWLYNPLTIVVCTRGNAESVMSALVLLTILLLKQGHILSCGVFFGLAVHFKIYPIIYAMPIYFSLHDHLICHTKDYVKLLLPSRKKIKFTFASLTTYFVLTAVCYLLYGDKYIQEAFLYHIIRQDTRHNFSVYFYMLYLTASKSSLFVSIVTFLPQFVLIILFAFKFHRSTHLPFCLFSVTFVFVTFNKVCTSQYFLWYLCLIPLIATDVKLGIRKSVTLLVLWFCGQGIWLLPAYFLEMKGCDTFIFIWLAGIVFFIVNLYILVQLIYSYRLPKIKRK